MMWRRREAHKNRRVGVPIESVDAEEEGADTDQDEDHQTAANGNLKELWNIPNPKVCSMCPTKPQGNGKNWHEVSEDTGKPKGLLCYRCGHFFDGSGLPPQDLVRMRNKTKASKELLASQIEDANKADPSLREFQLEEVYAEERTTTMILERHEWQSRALFLPRTDRKISP